MKVGVLVPYTNTNLEQDLLRLRLPSVSYHITRIGGYELDDIPDENQMQTMGAASLKEPLHLISGFRPDAVLYGCTSATLAHGLAFTKNLEQEISQATGAIAISAAGALITALNALGVERIGFASPYVGVLNDHAVSFLTEAGFEVVSKAEFAAELSNHQQGEVSCDQIYQLACQADSDAAQAIVLACTDLRAVEVIERIEKALDKPVVTSNQAMIHALTLNFPTIDPSPLPGRIAKAARARTTASKVKP